MQGVFDRKMAEMKEKIQGSEYSIGKPVVEGKTARVPITTTYKGEVENNEVQMVKIDGTWFLSSLMDFQMKMHK